jgi:2-octaprenyl-6-methoxyphenol hydroxylase
MEQSPGTRQDVLIIGGGLTGLALACALGSSGASACLVERRPLEAMVEPAHDGRVTAIARGSRQLLERIGAWRHIVGGAQPILDIEVGEGGSPARVHYDHRAVGDEPLGWIVENRVIRRGLMDRLAELDGIEVAAPAEIAALERLPGRVEARLADSRELRASLLAVCEGRFSTTREAAGIGARRWTYGQTGIVCSFAHEKPHGGRAVERFFPDGPFAILPQTGTADHPHRSSIVWALRDDVAASVMQLADGPFTAEAQVRVGEELGALELASRRWHYPLTLVWADAYTAHRLVLVGDAARGIHPIAGQGWNLALRDVASVAEIVEDRIRLGLDPGDAVALERYAAWRSFDSLMLVAVTDGINRLFANDILPIKLARNLGLGLVERTPPLKRFFMRHAMGLVGELPRLMREDEVRA